MTFRDLVVPATGPAMSAMARMRNAPAQIRSKRRTNAGGHLVEVGVLAEQLHREAGYPSNSFRVSSNTFFKAGP